MSEDGDLTTGVEFSSFAVRSLRSPIPSRDLRAAVSPLRTQGAAASPRCQLSPRPFDFFSGRSFSPTMKATPPEPHPYYPLGLRLPGDGYRPPRFGRDAVLGVFFVAVPLVAWAAHRFASNYRRPGTAWRASGYDKFLTCWLVVTGRVEPAELE